VYLGANALACEDPRAMLQEIDRATGRKGPPQQQQQQQQTPRPPAFMVPHLTPEESARLHEYAGEGGASDILSLMTGLLGTSTPAATFSGARDTGAAKAERFACGEALQLTTDLILGACRPAARY